MNKFLLTYSLNTNRSSRFDHPLVNVTLFHQNKSTVHFNQQSPVNHKPEPPPPPPAGTDVTGGRGGSTSLRAEIVEISRPSCRTFGIHQTQSHDRPNHIDTVYIGVFATIHEANERHTQRQHNATRMLTRRRSLGGRARAHKRQYIILNTG